MSGIGKPFNLVNFDMILIPMRYLILNFDTFGLDEWTHDVPCITH